MTYFWWLLGCLWCCELPSDAFMTTHMSKKNLSNMKNIFKSKGHTSCVYSLFFGMFRALHLSSNGLLRHIKARNGIPIIWVLNNEEELTEMKNLFGNNLMGVMTDKPTMLKNFCGDLE